MLLDHAQPAYVPYSTSAWCVSNALMLCLPSCLPASPETTVPVKLENKLESTDKSYRKPRLPFRERICCLNHRDKSSYHSRYLDLTTPYMRRMILGLSKVDEKLDFSSENA